MTNRPGSVAEGAALGLAIGVLGCTREPGFTLDDEAEGTTGNDDPVGDGDGDPDTGDTDTGDTGPNDIPFALVSGGMNATGKFVALRFTEPVGPVDGIDPGDFRISYARRVTYCYYECVDQTKYWDPNFYAHYYVPYQPYSYDRFEVDLVTAGMQPTDVFLRFETPLHPVLCNYTGNAYESGLYVHYSPGAIPLTSADGESLAGIGTQWVEEPGAVFVTEGVWPNLVPKIAIPCNLAPP